MHHTTLSAPPCKICSSSTEAFKTYDLNKNCGNVPVREAGTKVPYYQCIKCSFIFTNWFDNRDLKKLIYNKDYIKFDPDFEKVRPEGFAQAILRSGIDPNLKLLDYGSGNGTMARMLRKSGLDCKAYDPFFSTAKLNNAQYDIVFAYEVIEHSVKPLQLIETLKSLTHYVSIRTLLYQSEVDDWYIAPRNGHISIFTLPTMKYLGIKSTNQGEHYILC